MKDFSEHIKKYPHNTNCTDRFMKLVELAYQKDTKGRSLEEFCQDCLDRFGGTIAGAMIDYLDSKL